jgi:hypothetical protein
MQYVKDADMCETLQPTPAEHESDPWSCNCHAVRGQRVVGEAVRISTPAETFAYQKVRRTASQTTPPPSRWSRSQFRDPFTITPL